MSNLIEKCVFIPEGREVELSAPTMKSGTGIVVRENNTWCGVDLSREQSINVVNYMITELGIKVEELQFETDQN